MLGGGARSACGAAAEDPSHSKAHIAAGRVHEPQGRVAEALECYRKAAEADPADAEAHAAAGRVHESQGRAAEALEWYRKAADITTEARGRGHDGTAEQAGAKESAGRARDRLLRKQSRLRDAGDMARHIRHTRRGRSDGRKG